MCALCPSVFSVSQQRAFSACSFLFHSKCAQHVHTPRCALHEVDSCCLSVCSQHLNAQPTYAQRRFLVLRSLGHARLLRSLAACSEFLNVLSNSAHHECVVWRVKIWPDSANACNLRCVFCSTRYTLVEDMKSKYKEIWNLKRFLRSIGTFAQDSLQDP